MAGVEVDLMQGRNRRAVHPAGGHELEGTIDLVGHLCVALAGRGRGHELTVPAVDLREVGVAAPGEGPKEVQGGRGPVVGGEQATRVGPALVLGEADVVDDLAQERRQLGVALRLGRARPGLGELTGDPPHLHQRDPTRVGEHDRHLQDHPQLVADRVGGGIERLGAIPGLEQERLAARHLAELGRECTRLAGEHQRWLVAEGLQDLIELSLVGPGRLVPGGGVAPALRSPGRAHASSLEAGDARFQPVFRQAASTASAMLDACSRTELIARFTRRRAASAVTPRSSPTSR